MTDGNAGSTTAAVRIADALLRSLGGTAVALRFPLAAASGQDAEQLGLAAPGFEDVPLGPAVFRKLRPQAKSDGTARYELMISATAMSAQMVSLGAASVGELFGAALGVVVDDLVLAVAGVTASEAYGAPYIYRVLLEGLQDEAV